MSWPLALVVGLAPLVATVLGTRAVLHLLRRRNIVDNPNERSSHAAPTPRGGGIAVIAVLVGAWTILWATGHGFAGGAMFWLVIGGAAVLAAVSWVDDVRGGLPAAPRFLIQMAAVAAGLFALPADGAILQGAVPLWADRLIAGLLWLWFINLFNFMDGIDGITGCKTGTIGIGIFVVGLTAGTAAPLALPGLAAAGVAVGFLVWNWAPAKVFLGDVGSVPLGHLLGWLLLMLAAMGHWDAALLLPAYYLADASLTLARRLARGEKPWQAHREHAYQVAVRAGRSHAEVSLMIAAVGIALAGLTLVGLGGGAARWASLAAGIFLVALFLWYLRRQPLPSAHGD